MRIRPGKARDGGMVVLVVLVVAAILVMLIAANARTLDHLKGRLRLLEEKQVEHWESR